MIIYVNKVEKRIMFMIKVGYYLEYYLTLKLLGSTISKIKKKDKNAGNVPHL